MDQSTHAQFASLDMRVRQLEKNFEEFRHDAFGDHSPTDSGGRLGKMEKRQNIIERKIDRAYVVIITLVIAMSLLSGSGLVSLKNLLSFFK